jgi:large subunit ribosomal protein L35
MAKKYKLKTHKGAQKRFRFSANGKMLRMHGLRSHLRRKRTGRVKRLYDQKVGVNPSDQARLKKLLPYGA